MQGITSDLATSVFTNAISSGSEPHPDQIEMAKRVFRDGFNDGVAEGIRQCRYSVRESLGLNRSLEAKATARSALRHRILEADPEWPYSAMSKVQSSD